MSQIFLNLDVFIQKKIVHIHPNFDKSATSFLGTEGVLIFNLLSAYVVCLSPEHEKQKFYPSLRTKCHKFLMSLTKITRQPELSRLLE
jgi:hypothetical protein